MAISTPADFVTKFHNLDGDLISERKKSFFTLLKAASQNLTSAEIDTGIENLNPKTYQEKLFWVETLVYFKKVAPLIEVLKKCNREHIKIVMRQKWFIREAFKDITPSELVNDFFPCVSYSTRLKLLWRIPNYWSEEKNDKLFDCVHERYGLFIALRVLHTCSTMKIEKLLKEQETILSSSQIIYLLTKNEDLFTTYINCYNNWCEKPYAEKTVLNSLTVKHPEIFLKLEKNHKISSEKLTRAASVRLINVAKKELFNDPHHFFKMLNTRTLVKCLGSEFRAFCKNIFPQKIEDLISNCSCFQLLKHFPKSARWELFTEVYRSAFTDKNLEEFLKIIDSSIIKLNPDRETIFKWAEIKYKTSGDDNFLIYYSPSVAIPILKEKINVTSDMPRRQDLLKLLITICAQNKDMASLDKVLEYIRSRHRNEEPNAYKRQIEFLLKTFKKDELTRNHWNFVHQQTIFLKTQGSVHFYDYKDIMIDLLIYSYKNDQDLFRVVVVDFLKDGCNSGSWNYGVDLGTSEFEREFFIEICKLFPITISTDHQYFKEVQCSIIRDFIAICKKYPNKCMNMSEYPHFVSAIEEACNKKEIFSYFELQLVEYGLVYSIDFPQYALSFLNELKVIELLKDVSTSNIADKLLVSIAKKKSLSDLDIKIITFSLENLDIYTWDLKQSVTSLLLCHPRLLMTFIEKQWSNIDTNAYKVVKHYSHLGLDTMICDYLINNWALSEMEQQQMTLNILLKLLPANEFIDFCNKNVTAPKSTVELNNENDIKLHKIHCHVAGCLKNVVDPENYLTLLLKFCTRDYLQFALTSLYSLFARSPEKLLHSYLGTLAKQRLSVHKHSIFLSCELLDHTYVIKVLKNTNPDTHSVLKPLCSATLKYFVKTGYEDVFVLVKKYVSMIVTYDKEIFSTLAKVATPKKYRSRFIEICWKTLQNVENKKNKVNKYLDKLLEQTFDKDIIKSLSPSFVNNNITRYLAREGIDRLMNINRFTVLCLVHRVTERQVNYKLVFEILPKLNRKNIRSFCNTFVEYLNDKRDSMFVNEFIQHWKQSFSLIDTLDELIILNLLLKRANKSEEDNAKYIVDYLEQILSELGPRVFEIFTKNFEEQVNGIKEFNTSRHFQLMLNYKQSPTVCILILQLLKPVRNEDNEEVKTAFKHVIETIKLIEEPIVKCYYEIYLFNNDQF